MIKIFSGQLKLDKNPVAAGAAGSVGEVGDGFNIEPTGWVLGIGVVWPALGPKMGVVRERVCALVSGCEADINVAAAGLAVNKDGA